MIDSLYESTEYVELPVRQAYAEAFETPLPCDAGGRALESARPIPATTTMTPAPTTTRRTNSTTVSAHGEGSHRKSGIVLVTDHSSKEESRPKLSAAVELLTGAPPITVDARHFMPGGNGRARNVRGNLTLEVASEGLLMTPAVVLVYEIPPADRRRFERFLRVVRASGVACLDADPGAWRNATEKNRTVSRFRRDSVAHMETVSLYRPSPALAIKTFRRLGQDVWARPTVGFGGGDVFHLTTVEHVEGALRYYASCGQDWMMSRDALNFTAGGWRHQYRVIVLDDRVLRVCEHVQGSLDAPCNEAQGAVSTVVPPEDLPSVFLELAVAATRSLGLRFGGVDLAIENGGVVFEVNVHPVLAPVGGLEMVAVPYVDAHLEAMARRPT